MKKLGGIISEVEEIRSPKLRNILNNTPRRIFIISSILMIIVFLLIFYIIIRLSISSEEGFSDFLGKFVMNNS